MAKNVTKFLKRHLAGRGMLECVCVCVCRVSYRILSSGKGRGLQSSVSGGHAPSDFFFF